MLKPQDMEYLNQIAVFEAENKMKTEYRLGWCHRDVKIPGAILSHLHFEGFLDLVYRSNSRTGYSLSQKGKEVIAAMRTPYRDLAELYAVTKVDSKYPGRPFLGRRRP